MSTTVNTVKKEASQLKQRKKAWTRTRVFSIVWDIVHAVIVFGICFIILYPIFVKLSVSVRSEKDLYDTTVVYIPRQFSMETINEVWTFMEYPKLFLNSLYLSFVVSLCQIVSCTLVGYGFARFKFPFRKLLFALVIFCLIVPPQTIQLSIFLHFKKFDFFGIMQYIFGMKINMLDKFIPFAILSLTCQGFKNGLYIYMMRQNFRGIPAELEEAAYVDGAGFFKTFSQVLLPSALSMMLTVFLFSFVWQWTDTFYTGLFLTKTEVLSTSLASLATNLQHQRAGALAGMDIIVSPGFSSQVNNIGSIMVMIPLLVIYLFTQRYFVESIERSGIVG